MELQTIQNKIYEIRGQRVMLDRDLAELYGVETKALNKAVKRNTAILVNRAIMKAFVAMRNYIMTTSTITAELSEIRAKLTLLERADEDNAQAVNDLSEDVRKELDNIYEAIAALSVKVPQARRPARPIGFKLPEEEK